MAIKIWRVRVNGRFKYDVSGDTAFQAAEKARVLHQDAKATLMLTWEPSVRLEVEHIADLEPV